MNRISALLKETLEGSLSLLPHEDSVKRWLSMNQEVGSHQTLNLPAPQFWTSSLQNCEK